MQLQLRWRYCNPLPRGVIAPVKKNMEVGLEANKEKTMYTDVFSRE
jgi:hypothetical protein